MQSGHGSQAQCDGVSCFVFALVMEDVFVFVLYCSGYGRQAQCDGASCVCLCTVMEARLNVMVFHVFVFALYCSGHGRQAQCDGASCVCLVLQWSWAPGSV